MDPRTARTAPPGHPVTLHGGGPVDAIRLQRVTQDPQELHALFDSQWRLLEATPALMELLGYEPGVVARRPIEDFLHLDDWEKIQSFKEMFLRGERLRWTTRLRRADGDPVDVEISARLIEGGRLSVTVSDVSELRRFQRALARVSTALARGGRELFPSLVRGLTRGLSVDYAFVGEVRPGATDIWIPAMNTPRGLRKGLSHPMAETAFGAVLEETQSLFTSRAREDFPEDPMLSEFGVQTFQALRLVDEGGRCLGLIGWMDRRALEPDELRSAMLDLSASRVSAEMARRQVDEELRRTSRKLQNFVEGSSSFLWSTDPEGNATQATQAQEWWRYSGQRLEDSAEGGWLDMVAPEDRDWVRAAFERALSEQDELDIVYGVETLERGLRFLEVRGVPLFDVSGEFEGMFGTATDVTDRELMLKLLRVVPEAANGGAEFSEALLVGLKEICRLTGFSMGRALVRDPEGPSFSNFSLWVDESSKISKGVVEWLGGDSLVDNPHCPVGFSAGEGPVWVENVEGVDAPECVDALKDFGVASVACIPVRFGEDTVAMLEVFSETPIQRSHSLLEALGQVGVQLGRCYERDLNLQQLLEVERQALVSQKLEAVGRLAGGVAHDFNNILQAILGETGLALLEEDLDPEIRLAFREIDAAGQRAAALTRQLLSFARRDMPGRERVSLRKLVGEVERMLVRLLPETIRLEVAFESADDDFTVDADPAQLQQVLMNLVVNARDAMPDGGKVTVRLSRPSAVHRVPRSTGPDPILLSVCDTGTGVPESIRDTLFEPFVTTKEDGTGLGLATSFRIIQESGGILELHSEAGAGSEFWVWLPSVDGSDEVEPDAADAVLHSDRADASVLVVEDEDAVRSVALRVLRKAGYEVDSVRDGYQAKRLLQTSRVLPDVLLTDVVLPGPSGPDLAREYWRRRPDGRVVFMSGYTADHFDRYPRTSGSVFLSKPFRPDQLLGAVDGVRLDQAALDSGEGAGWFEQLASKFVPKGGTDD